jgi:uncharacterized repeat protein (TIGR03847 family)
MKDFGQAELVEAEAIGEPGKRTFRLRVQSGSESAALWFEKEQLAALSLAIRQVLQQTGSKEPSSEPEPAPPTDPFPEQPDIDFKIARLGIGYDEEKGLVAIFAYEQSEEPDAEPTFTCQLGRGQSRALAQQAEKAVSAGRPVCVLCGSPIDAEGHKCLRRNGHSERPISRT